VGFSLLTFSAAAASYLQHPIYASYNQFAKFQGARNHPICILPCNLRSSSSFTRDEFDSRWLDFDLHIKGMEVECQNRFSKIFEKCGASWSWSWTFFTFDFFSKLRRRRPGFGFLEKNFVLDLQGKSEEAALKGD
jgi:hypothetical protein